jgi:uncharacterized protein (DUF697 family)
VIAMHDIDRTQLEFTQEVPYQSEEFEFQEFEGGMMEMNENEEIQLAHELLAVNNEQELEQFLGDFLKKAVSTVGSFVKSPVGQAIGGVLKGVAKKALPMAGTALGGYIGGPLGAKIGTGLANAAGKALGLEFEFGENEELEVTGARRFVKLAHQTARQAASAAAAGADPRQAAQQAAIAAARKFAPGLLSGPTGGMQGASGTNATGGMQSAGDGFGDMQAAGGALGAGAQGAMGAGRRGHSGRWVRQGRRIVVFGV